VGLYQTARRHRLALWASECGLERLASRQQLADEV
jgi:hypothetical protein